MWKRAVNLSGLKRFSGKIISVTVVCVVCLTMRTSPVTCHSPGVTGRTEVLVLFPLNDLRITELLQNAMFSVTRRLDALFSNACCVTS